MQGLRAVEQLEALGTDHRTVGGFLSGGPYVDSMSTSGRRPVLLVDDDPDWRDLIEELLDAAGLAVAAATDGRGAWRSFLKSEPLVVVTDIQMPFMDGRELLANVRARNFRVPVIVVTACEAQICTGDLTGAYAVIAKPADPEEVIATVKAAMGHRASHTPLAKMWTVGGPLRGLHPAEPTLLPNSRWWKRRERAAAVVSGVVAALLIAIIVATRRRMHLSR